MGLAVTLRTTVVCLGQRHAGAGSEAPKRYTALLALDGIPARVQMECLGFAHFLRRLVRTFEQLEEGAASGEDHHLRSAAMWRMFAGTLGSASPSVGRAKVPRTLVQFWHDMSSLPRDVALCMASWRVLCVEGVRYRLFDDKLAAEFIGSRFGEEHLAAYQRCHHPAMKADYFRLCFVLAEGGLYVDADDAFLGRDPSGLFATSSLKLQPLCYDQEAREMVAATEFLAEPHPRMNCTYYVNNNPLAAPPQHPVIEGALSRATSRLLSAAEPFLDIQETTGPGNLTASLVRLAETQPDSLEVEFLVEWSQLAESQWPLEYRGDERNWRVWMESIHRGLADSSGFRRDSSRSL